MGDTLIKFKAGECFASSCGSRNPIAAAIAQATLAEFNSFSVIKANEPAVPAMSSIIQEALGKGR